MAQKLPGSMREVIEWLKGQGELLVITKEVDPIHEIAGIEKALEGGPALLFENIKGYPGVRDVGNMFSNDERVAKMFGVDDIGKVKFKCLEALRHPIPPKVVKAAPCQEVVIKEDIDVMGTLPILKHSDRDGARI